MSKSNFSPKLSEISCFWVTFEPQQRENEQVVENKNGSQFLEVSNSSMFMHNSHSFYTVEKAKALRWMFLKPAILVESVNFVIIYSQPLLDLT